MIKTKHWTEDSVKDYYFSVSSDFTDQLNNRLDDLDWNRNTLAKKLSVTEGRVSQIFNNPGNLTLRTMIECSRHAGMKLTILTYDDGDPQNLRGPINSEVFRSCWNQFQKPYDGWTLDENISAYRQNIREQLEFDFIESIDSLTSEWHQQRYIPEFPHACSEAEVKNDEVEDKLSIEIDLVKKTHSIYDLSA